MSKGGEIMGKMDKYILKPTVSLLKNVVTLSSNSACFSYSYQHKLPESAKKYRKF